MYRGVEVVVIVNHRNRTAPSGWMVRLVSLLHDSGLLGCFVEVFPSADTAKNADEVPPPSPTAMSIRTHFASDETLIIVSA